MAVFIRLLGRPRVEAGGREVPGPRGRKSWALLAVVLLADRPLTRRSLAGLLFPDAADPLGALRWTLSQLRCALAGELSAAGDPVVVRLRPACRVDVVDLLAGQAAGADGGDGGMGVLDPPETFLDGADGIAGADFDLWLTAARHRVDAARGALLRQTAGVALAGAQPSKAVAAAARAAVVDPDGPGARASLVSSLVSAGDYQAALAQLAEWSQWIRRELQVSRLLRGQSAGAYGPTQQRDTDAVCRIEAGQAAMAAGAVPAGLGHLRDAVRLATQRADERLQARALLALGGSLVHAVAAHAPEGTQALRDAARLAQRAGDHRVAAEALRDLAYVANTGGRVASTRRLLSAAAAAAGDDAYVMSSVRAIEGMFLADRGGHDRALRALRESVHLAEAAGRARQAAWSASIASRSLLQRGQLDAARDYAEQSVQIAAGERWTAMLPWMESLLADLDLADGRVDDASRRLEHAWSLSLVLGDWCWQAMAARGLGLAAFARGDLPGALRWLTEAGRRAARNHDRYAWIHAWVQDAVCRVTVAAQLPGAADEASRLAALAVSSHQPEFAARARHHQATLGARAVPMRTR